MTTAINSMDPVVWTIEGFSEEGEAEVTRIALTENEEWSEEEADDQCRYFVTRTNVREGLCVEYDGFDVFSEAREWAHHLVAEARAEYATREGDRREALAEALEDLVGDTAEDSAEQLVLEVLARLIGRGQAGAVRAALETARLV